ncbi:MAG: DUF4198 domain-containing protein [Chitinophagaceae bacterium]
MKKIFFTLFILCAITVTAHEFWLQPSAFIYKKGDKATISFRIGENFVGENWSGNRSKINFLSFYQNGIKKDIASSLSNKNGDSLQLTLSQEGTAVVVYNGINSFIELDAIKFNEYLKEDGLQNAIDYRKHHNETDSMSYEAYQRSVKTILQVGKKYDNTFSKETTLPLDIIPLSHPYKVKNKQALAFKILFQKKPIVKHLIKLWHRVNNKTIFAEKMTDEKGMVSFMIFNKGKWMVSAVQMIRIENEPKASWQSYWGSCTWGYE